MSEEIKNNLTENLLALDQQKRILKEAKKELKEECMNNGVYAKLEEDVHNLKAEMKEIMMDIATQTGLQERIVEAKAESEALQEIVTTFAIQLMEKGGLTNGEELAARGFTFTPKIKVTFNSKQMKMNL